MISSHDAYSKHTILKERLFFIKNLIVGEPSLVVNILQFILLYLLLKFSHCFGYMSFTPLFSLVVLLVWAVPLKVSKLIALEAFNLGHVFLLGLTKLFLL